jgi:hypothetical protein
MEELKKGFMGAFGVVLGYAAGAFVVAKAYNAYEKINDKSENETSDEDFVDLNN